VQTIIVERHTEIARPIEVVRRQFVDMEHHARTGVHPDLEVRDVRRQGDVCSFIGRRRVLGMLHEDAMEVRSLPDGSSTLRSLRGSNAGLLVTQFFEALGPSSTRVKVRVELPLKGPLRLLAPVVKIGLARDTEAALAQDKADLEQRYGVESTG
jgi:hypothetical protein